MIVRLVCATLGAVCCVALVDEAAAQARIDIASSQSTLSEGLEPWEEVSAALSLRQGDRFWTIYAEESERFGLADFYTEVRLEQRQDWGAIAFAVGGASDADFRPEAALKATLMLNASRDMAWRIDLDASRYGDADVYTTQAGFERRFRYRNATVSARVIGTGNERISAGYALQGEFDLWPRFRGRLGYAEAPEFSEGDVLQVTAWSVATLVEVNDSLVLRADFAHEDRGAYERDVFSVGAGFRFAP